MVDRYNFVAGVSVDLVNGDTVVKLVDSYILADSTVEAQAGVVEIIRDIINEQDNDGEFVSPVKQIHVEAINWGGDDAAS